MMRPSCMTPRRPHSVFHFPRLARAATAAYKTDMDGGDNGMPGSSNPWKNEGADFQSGSARKLRRDASLETAEDGGFWRCFIALGISDEVRRAAAKLQRAIRETGAQVSCPAPENLHFTVAFLGATPPSLIGELSARLDAVAREIPAFELEVCGVGFFGPPHAPRVVWAGVAGVPPALVRLHEACQKILLELKFSIEDRPFRPHLTLGRVKSRRGVAELTSLVASVRSAVLGRVEAGDLLLMRSRVDAPEARYSIIRKSRLKER